MNATIALTYLVLALMRARTAVKSGTVETQADAIREVLARMAQLENCLATLDIPNVSAVAKFVCELEEAGR